MYTVREAEDMYQVCNETLLKTKSGTKPTAKLAKWMPRQLLCSTFECPALAVLCDPLIPLVNNFH